MGAGEGYFYELFGVWVYVVGTLRRAGGPSYWLEVRALLSVASEVGPGGPTNWRLLCARLDILGEVSFCIIIW